MAAVLLFIMALVVVPWSYSTWMQRTGSGSYGPGIAVTGSPSMSGAQVDKVLCQAQSPACRTGYTLYSYGAQYGIGKGRTGQAYALPTKDKHLNTLSLDNIDSYIERFAYYVNEGYADASFWMTRVGCGLAGYTDEDIAPLFDAYFTADAPISWPEDWRKFLEL